MNRLFTFGCSLTLYDYPTWADCLSINYDQYYNFGNGGASNQYIYGMLLEADNLVGFNKDTDLVIVMITGFCRFSYLIGNYEHMQWCCHGDMMNYCRMFPQDPLSRLYENVWTDELAVYQSWTAIKSIKNLLESKQIRHRILLGIDNRYYLEKEMDFPFRKKVDEIYQLVENKQSFMEWMELTLENNDSPKYIDENSRDGHPSIASHFKFVSEHLPDLITEESKNFKDYWMANFDYSNRKAMSTKFFKEFHMQKNRAWFLGEQLVR